MKQEKGFKICSLSGPDKLLSLIVLAKLLIWRLNPLFLVMQFLCTILARELIKTVVSGGGKRFENSNDDRLICLFV